MSTSRSIVVRTAAIAAAALVAVVVAGPMLLGSRPAGQANASPAVDPNAPVRGITVAGVGRVTLTPDLATISVGVQAQEQSAAKALSAASALMAKVIASVGSQGIADADLATQGISVEPQYEYSTSGTKPPRVIGYQATQSLGVKIRKIETSGAVIDAAVGAGATQVSGISFSVADPAAASAQARSAAVADARARAATLASAAGVQLGAAISVIEVSAPPPIPYQYDKAAPAAGAIAQTPVQPGTMEVEVDVQITFAIE